MGVGEVPEPSALWQPSPGGPVRVLGAWQKLLVSLIEQVMAAHVVPDGVPVMVSTLICMPRLYASCKR